MREGLRTALARLDVLEKERAQVCELLNEPTASTSDEGKRKANQVETRSSSRRASREAAKKTKYNDDSSDSENDNDPDFEIVQPPVESKQHQQQQKPKVTLQCKTITSYHGMRRKKLVELCSREGLPCNGSDDELKKRHSEFITLYNSECDAQYPRSVSELIKEIMKRENSRKVCLCCSMCLFLPLSSLFNCYYMV